MHRRNLRLLGVLLGMTAFLLLPKGSGHGLLTRGVLTLAFIECLYAISTNRRLFIIAAVLLLPGLISNWVDKFFPNPLLMGFSLFAQAAFLIYAAALLLGSVLSSNHRVSSDSILAAVNVYLILGVIWTFFYLMAFQSDPHAFRFANTLPEAPQRADQLTAHISQLAYYSFVTLSTLGYGDVTANASITRLLAVFEALCGQLYLVILMAGLVGRHTETKRNPNGEP